MSMSMSISIVVRHVDKWRERPDSPASKILFVTSKACLASSSSPEEVANKCSFSDNWRAKAVSEVMSAEGGSIGGVGGPALDVDDADDDDDDWTGMLSES